MRNGIELETRVNEYSSNIPSKNIIAAFPGIGKSTAAEKYPNIFIDMESSDYHWIIDDNGDKICHPDWPVNYVDAIIKKCEEDIEIGKAHYVLTSTHKEVLEEFKKRSLYYTAVIPKTLSIMVERYKNRGSSEQFIQSLEKNFEKYIQDVRSSSAFLLYTSDKYLVDIFIPVEFQ